MRGIERNAGQKETLHFFLSFYEEEYGYECAKSCGDYP